MCIDIWQQRSKLYKSLSVSTFKDKVIAKVGETLIEDKKINQIKLLDNITTKKTQVPKAGI